MTENIIKKYKSKFQGAIDHFNSEAAKIRTGRANPAMVEGIMVNYYGTKTPLKQVASINVPESRLIMIQPWDKDSLVNIEAAIKESDLGINPNNDGQIIRLNIPSLTEERRRDLVKVLHKKAEESRVSIRGIREDILKEIQNLEKDEKISEDEKFKSKDALQKEVDEYNKKVEEIMERKEKEILTI